MEYYTAVKMGQMKTTHDRRKSGKSDPQHKSQEGVSLCRAELGGVMRGLLGLAMFCVFIWVVVTWVWSVYEKFAKLYGWGLCPLCILYIHKRFFKSLSFINSSPMDKTPSIGKSEETDGRLEAARG